MNPYYFDEGDMFEGDYLEDMYKYGMGMGTPYDIVPSRSSRSGSSSSGGNSLPYGGSATTGYGIASQYGVPAQYSGMVNSAFDYAMMNPDIVDDYMGYAMMNPGLINQYYQYAATY